MLRALALSTISIFAGAATIAACSGDPTAEDLASTESAVLAGRQLTAAEVAGHVRAAGFAENLVGKMTCTAKYESTFFERAENSTQHRGLFQISPLHIGRKGCPTTAEGLFDGLANTKCAKSVFDSQGIGAWTAYAAHKAECDSFVAPPSTTPTTVADGGAPTTTTPPKPAEFPCKGEGTTSCGKSGNDGDVLYECKNGGWRTLQSCGAGLCKTVNGKDACQRPGTGKGPSCGQLVDEYNKSKGVTKTGLCEQHDTPVGNGARNACSGKGKTTFDCDHCCYIIGTNMTAPIE